MAEVSMTIQRRTLKKGVECFDKLPCDMVGSQKLAKEKSLNVVFVLERKHWKCAKTFHIRRWIDSTKFTAFKAWKCVFGTLFCHYILFYCSGK